MERLLFMCRKIVNRVDNIYGYRYSIGTGPYVPIFLYSLPSHAACENESPMTLDLAISFVDSGGVSIVPGKSYRADVLHDHIDRGWPPPSREVFCEFYRAT